MGAETVRPLDGQKLGKVSFLLEVDMTMRSYLAGSVLLEASASWATTFLLSNMADVLVIVCALCRFHGSCRQGCHHTQIFMDQYTKALNPVINPKVKPDRP